MLNFSVRVEEIRAATEEEIEHGHVHGLGGHHHCCSCAAAVIPVEICIDASQASSARTALTAAYVGGADRVEVCASMDVGEPLLRESASDSPAMYLSTALGSSAW